MVWVAGLVQRRSAACSAQASSRVHQPATAMGGMDAAVQVHLVAAGNDSGC